MYERLANSGTYSSDELAAFWSAPSWIRGFIEQIEPGGNWAQHNDVFNYYTLRSSILQRRGARLRAARVSCSESTGSKGRGGDGSNGHDDGPPLEVVLALTKRLVAIFNDIVDEHLVLRAFATGAAPPTSLASPPSLAWFTGVALLELLVHSSCGLTTGELARLTTADLTEAHTASSAFLGGFAATSRVMALRDGVEARLGLPVVVLRPALAGAAPAAGTGEDRGRCIVCTSETLDLLRRYAVHVRPLFGAAAAAATDGALFPAAAAGPDEWYAACLRAVLPRSWVPWFTRSAFERLQATATLHKAYYCLRGGSLPRAAIPSTPVFSPSAPSTPTGARSFAAAYGALEQQGAFGGGGEAAVAAAVAAAAESGAGAGTRSSGPLLWLQLVNVAAASLADELTLFELQDFAVLGRLYSKLVETPIAVEGLLKLVERSSLVATSVSKLLGPERAAGPPLAASLLAELETPLTLDSSLAARPLWTPADDALLLSLLARAAVYPGVYSAEEAAAVVSATAVGAAVCGARFSQGVLPPESLAAIFRAKWTLTGVDAADATTLGHRAGLWRAAAAWTTQDLAFADALIRWTGMAPTRLAALGVRPVPWRLLCVEVGRALRTTVTVELLMARYAQYAIAAGGVEGAFEASCETEGSVAGGGGGAASASVGASVGASAGAGGEEDEGSEGFALSGTESATDAGARAKRRRSEMESAEPDGGGGLDSSMAPEPEPDDPDAKRQRTE